MATHQPVDRDAEIARLQRELAALREELKTANRRAEEAQLELLRTQAAMKTLKAAESDLRALMKNVEGRAELLARERKTAREFQERLTSMWQPDIPGLAIAVESRISEQVGADFYELIEIADGVLCMVIADVAGHGLQATLIMALAKMAFRDAAGHFSSPRDILMHVNRQLLDATLERHYLMAFVAVVDVNQMQLRYVNASHCCPLLVSKRALEPLDSLGLFVGMFEDPNYEERSTSLHTGDRIFLFSDGFVHALGIDSMQDSERIHRCFRGAWERPVQDVVEDFARRIGPEIEDDVTLIGVQILREEVPSRTIVIPSIPSELGKVERAILPILVEKGFSERALFALRLSLEEAVINAIKHGNKLDPSKKVRIDFRLEDDQAKIVVEDEGPGFNPTEVPDPTLPEYLDRETGRGLMLIENYMDEVHFNPKGNAVTLIKYAPWSVREKKS